MSGSTGYADRGRVGELDAGTKYLLYCAVGLRGYVAERILTQRGFDAANLAGGYHTWRDMEASIDRPIPEHMATSNTESTRLIDPKRPTRISPSAR